MWSMLAGIAARTERIELATGVTCPFIRYHPAIIVQAAATTALLSDGRFTLGVGSGERLNEHVVGRGWPPVHVRHRVFRESLEIIRLLWQGGYLSYEGEHLTVEDARAFDLPPQSPRIAVAAGGPRAARLAGELGDGLFVTEPRADLVETFRAAGVGDGPRYAEVPLSYAATATVTTEHMRQAFGCGPDSARHVEVARPFVEAGCDHLALISAGPDGDGFFDHVAGGPGDELRAL